jgi:hypothetical protein
MPKNVVKYLSDADCRRIGQVIDDVLSGRMTMKQGAQKADAIVRKARKVPKTKARGLYSAPDRPVRSKPGSVVIQPGKRKS